MNYLSHDQEVAHHGQHKFPSWACARFVQEPSTLYKQSPVALRTMYNFINFVSFVSNLYTPLEY